MCIKPESFVAVKTKAMLLCIVLFCGGLSAHAEMRTWTDINGRKFEAEFVQEIFESVILKTPKGKELDIKVNQLSPDDLTYVRTMVPPEVTVSFSTRTQRKERSIYARPDDEIQIVTGVITIEKERYPLYLGTLIAEVFMIGREIATPDVYVLLGRSREDFTLTREDDEEHTFEVSVEARRYREYNDQTRGAEFAGYVIVIEDQSGHRVTQTSDISWMTEDKTEALRELYVRSFFNQSCRKVPVPRPDYYDTRGLFGRSKVRSVK
jgi:hypothetical protein